MVEKNVLLCFVKIVNFSGVHLALIEGRLSLIPRVGLWSGLIVVINKFKPKYAVQRFSGLH